MAIWGPSKIIRLDRWLPCSAGWSDSTTASAAAAAAAGVWKRKEKSRGGWLVVLNCSPLQVNPVVQQKQTDHDDSMVLKEGDEDVGIMCEPCNGRGWLLCDFCEGQKTNVKAANNRIYRRCPNCKAAGYVLCSKCKVFKCVTYPDYSDGEL